jgi:outer membrane protein assembly factor BamB
MRKRALLVLYSVLILSAGRRSSNPPGITPKNDWLQFSTASVETSRRAITTKNVDRLALRWRSSLPEGCDGSPVYVNNIFTRDGSLHDLVIVSTTIGRVLALDARDGQIVWQTTPAEGPRWTTSSPAIDPARRFVFAYGLDGNVHKYAIESGREITGKRWPAKVTLKPEVEKGSSNITIAVARDGHTYLYMPVAAYPDPGDDGNYQGHLVTIDIENGEQRVFNALCSDRTFHFDWEPPHNCNETQAGIWARSGAVYEPMTDRIFVTTGNGDFDADRGGFNWGSSVVALRPDGSTDGGTPLDSYTPDDFQFLTEQDLDLSSTTIEILPRANWRTFPPLGVQAGKDGRLRLLNLSDLSGTRGPRQVGGELQLVDLPEGGAVMTQPRAWLDPMTLRTWLYVTNDRGTVAYRLTTGADPQLEQRWTSNAGGTTPVVSNGVVFIASAGVFTALDARSGKLLWDDATLGDVHWQSPILVNGMVYVACDTELRGYALQ